MSHHYTTPKDREKNTAWCQKPTNPQLEVRSTISQAEGAINTGPAHLTQNQQQVDLGSSLSRDPGSSATLTSWEKLHTTLKMLLLPNSLVQKCM